MTHENAADVSREDPPVHIWHELRHRYTRARRLTLLKTMRIRKSQRLATTAMVVVGLTWAAAHEVPALTAIITSPRARARYLAYATIWRAPEALTPDDILDGPKGAFPYTFQQATADEGIDCLFAKPGKELGGNSLKFLCTTNDGRPLRVKYWDPVVAQGNREVFAEVAATRLLWALGFDALPAYSLNVSCQGCPRNPFKGEGPAGLREDVGAVQAYPPGGPWILSRNDRDEGWSWRELDEAIGALAPGPERVRQRTHFDALTLLSVFMQHGDRKPEQQALYCSGSVAHDAGDTRPWPNDPSHMMLLERPEAPSVRRRRR